MDYPRINLDMVYFVLLFLEVVVLFLFSRNMSKVLFKFLSINLLSFLLLPGVIIHELSHLLIAAILFVPVGNMEFTPKKSENGLKLGSIEIAKTDPIRRSIIGFAPVLIGLAIILGLTHIFVDNNSIVQTIEPNSILGIGVKAFIVYLMFAISNTMFSSRADMEGAVEILITLLIIFIAVYILGYRPSLDFLEKIFTGDVIEVVKKSSLFLLVPIAIDIVLLGIIKLLHKR